MRVAPRSAPPSRVGRAQNVRDIHHPPRNTVKLPPGADPGIRRGGVPAGGAGQGGVAAESAAPERVTAAGSASSFIGVVRNVGEVVPSIDEAAQRVGVGAKRVDEAARRVGVGAKRVGAAARSPGVGAKRVGEAVKRVLVEAKRVGVEALRWVGVLRKGGGVLRKQVGVLPKWGRMPRKSVGFGSGRGAVRLRRRRASAGKAVLEVGEHGFSGDTALRCHPSGGALRPDQEPRFRSGQRCHSIKCWRSLEGCNHGSRKRVASTAIHWPGWVRGYPVPWLGVSGAQSATGAVTPQSGVTRMISARKAPPKERRIDEPYDR